MSRLVVFVFAVSLAVLSGCNAAGSKDVISDAAGQDTFVGDGQTLDTAQPDLLDTASGDLAEDLVTDTVEPNPGVFDIRLPQSTTINCEGLPEGYPTEYEFPQMDWICTFAYGEAQAKVYVQSDPSGCHAGMGATPLFQTAGAWVHSQGQTTDLTNAKYDWGAGHHNDSLEFDYLDKHFKYYHSSFGWGWRSCQSMDCLQVYSPDGKTLLEDGCTMERTLPVVCRLVKANGTIGLLDDHFAPCNGDPNYMDTIAE